MTNLKVKYETHSFKNVFQWEKERKKSEKKLVGVGRGPPRHQRALKWRVRKETKRKRNKT